MREGYMTDLKRKMVYNHSNNERKGNTIQSRLEQRAEIDKLKYIL
jgi:hypothetical protein